MLIGGTHKDTNPSIGLSMYFIGEAYSVLNIPFKGEANVLDNSPQRRGMLVRQIKKIRQRGKGKRLKAWSVLSSIRK